MEEPNNPKSFFQRLVPDRRLWLSFEWGTVRDGTQERHVNHRWQECLSTGY